MAVWSPSPRRAWIEILVKSCHDLAQLVALPTEGVDRNGLWSASRPRRRWVALPTEGVDRNLFAGGVVGIIGRVALPTEGVDRNGPGAVHQNHEVVALPTEGVDRNADYDDAVQGLSLSPSPRRAWIEISGRPRRPRPGGVALPTEGVDRNNALFV